MAQRERLRSASDVEIGRRQRGIDPSIGRSVGQFFRHGSVNPITRSAAVLCLPGNLYILPAPWPRLGRPPKHEVATWHVLDDWPDAVPASFVETGVFEAWFGALFDAMLGPG